MKNMKKIVCVLMALVMVLSMGLSVFADGAQTVKINGHASGHTYEAYQIFDGDYHDGVLSNPVWGTGIDQTKKVDGKTVFEALKTDTTDIEGKNFATLFAAATNEAGIASIISAEFSTDGKLLDHFAAIVGKYLTTPASTATSTTTEYTITNLDAGYYLIKDMVGTVNGYDYYTKYILTLVGTDNSMNEVTVKGDVPKVDKLVSQTGEAGTYGAVTDQMIGQKVHYIIEGTLPSNYLDYTYYDYIITDTLSKGLTYNGDASITILHPDATTADITSTATITAPVVIAPDFGGGDLIISWTQAKGNDLRSNNIAVVPGDKIIIKYSATVNEDAIIGGTGNPNTVVLQYSNEPNGGGYGQTPPAKPVVYVFQMDVLKTDAANHALKLPGAEFVLYHQHVISGVTVNEYAVLDFDTATATYTVKSWTEDIESATTLVSNDNGEFFVKGIRGGLTYYLKETKAPAGYHVMDTDVAVILQPVYSGTALTSLGYQVDGKEGTGDISTGSVDVTILNDRGNTLPSTGGMGTTLFYVVGGILFVGAAVVLITKKRMSNEA